MSINALMELVSKLCPELETQEQEDIKNITFTVLCKCCGVPQDILEFSVKKGKHKGEKLSYCRKCRNEWQKLRKYFAAIHPKPECCEMCDRPFGKGGLRPDIDHDHDTKEFRGWLHANCNKGLGMFEHSKDICQDAIKYLQTKE